MLCSVDLLGTGAFPPVTPKENPPRPTSERVLVTIQSAIRSAPVR